MLSRLSQWLVSFVGSYSEALVFGSRLGVQLPAFLRIRRVLRGLDRGSRWVAIASLLLLIVLVASVCVFYAAPGRFAMLAWTESGQRVVLPRFALYASLAGWAFSSAAILAGASRTSVGVFVGAGLIQLVGIVFAAFPGGKTYGLAAPSWLLPIIVAMSPAIARTPLVRGAATAVLAALATWHTYLFTPLSTGGQPPRWGWLFALFAAGTLALLRMPRVLTSSRVFVIVFAVNAGLLLQALRAGEAALAQGLVLPTNFLLGLFAVLWFTLGGELVGGAVSAANAAITFTASTLRRNALPLLLGFVCLAEVVLAPWLLDRLAASDAATLSLHRWVAIGVLGLGLALAARRRLRREWTRGLLAVWVFSLAALRAYFSEVTELAAYADARDLEAMALTLFTFGVALEVVKLLTEKPEGPGHAGRLLLSLGALTFLATGTQFGFASGNAQVMKEAASYQFAGATALFLPLLLALLLTEQRWLAAPDRAVLTGAFVAGFVAAFGAQLLRIASQRAGGWSLAGHLGAVALGDALKLGCIGGIVVGWRVTDRLGAAAVGGACALGFAAGYAQNLVVLTLNAGAKIVLLLTVRSVPVSQAFSELVAGDLRMRPLLPAADYYHLGVASLLPAVIMAGAIARGLRQAGWTSTAVGVVLACMVSLGLSWALHVTPLLTTESREPVPFYVVIGDPRALTVLALSVAALALWVYASVWRPARRGSLEGGPGVIDERRAPGPKPLTGLAAIAASLGGIGIALALVAPAPMHEYRDPHGRFAIDHPRGWHVRVMPNGETKVYEEDPVRGLLLVMHPGVPLPPGIAAATLVQALERQLRAVYEDVRVTASASPARVAEGRSVQNIGLTVSWAAAGVRFRGKSALTLVSSPTGTYFSYVSYQMPEPGSPTLEALLTRTLRSYRIDR